MAVNNRLSILQAGIFRGEVTDTDASARLTHLMQSIHAQVQNSSEAPSTLADMAFELPPGFTSLTQTQIAYDPDLPELEQRVSLLPEPELPKPEGLNTIWVQTGERTDWVKTTDGELLIVVTKIRELKTFEMKKIVVTEEEAADGTITKKDEKVTSVEQKLTEQQMKDLLDKQSGSK